MQRVKNKIMNYKTREDIQNRIDEHYAIAESLGYEVIGVFLQGSWNYSFDLCDDESDVDSKCLVLPTFEDFCLGRKPVSYTHICENDEHIDIKDLRLYLDCFKKQNVNFIEILFTDFYKVNPKYQEQWERLVEHREQIARYDIPRAISCMLGMAYEKKKAMCHRYPTLAAKIDEFGYDGKQVSHIARMYDVLEKYLAEVSYKECLVPDNPAELLAIKRNKYFGLDEAIKYVDEIIAKMEQVRNAYGGRQEKDRHVDVLFDEVAIECMTINFVSYLDNWR